MNFTQTITLLQDSGLVAKATEKGIGTHGIFNGYSVVGFISAKGDATVTFSLSTKLGKNHIKQLKTLTSKTIKASYNDDINLQINLKVSEIIGDDLVTSLNAVTNYFVQNGILNTTQCPICKNDGCDCATIYARTYTPIHTDCIKHIANANIKKANKMASGNIIFGIVGAIIGAFIGALPTILLIVVADYIFSILCILIPLASFWGYKLFKGKVNKATAIIVSLASLLQVFVIMVLTMWATTGFEYSLYVSMLLVVANFSMLTDMFAKILIFVGVGVFAAWGNIRRQPNDYIGNAMFIQSAALYYNFGGTGSSPYQSQQTATVADTTTYSSQSDPTSTPSSDSYQSLPENMRD